MSEGRLQRYPFPSHAEDHGLHLAAACASPERAPLYEGRLTTPQPAARALFALGQIADARFYVPPGMLRTILAAADPVVTVGAGVLRFEGFSRCCSVYARVDVLPDGHDADELRHGTTMVDFGPRLRGALGKLRLAGRLGLSVRHEGLGVHTEAGEHFEKRIDLEDRWLRSFLHLAAYSHRLERRGTLSWVQAHHLFQALPRARDERSCWLTPTGGTWGLRQRATDGAVRVTMPHRVRVAEPLVRGADEVVLLSTPDDEVSSIVVQHGPVRTTLLLTAEPSRGMSGEGVGLEAARRGAKGAIAQRRASLRWQAAIPDDDDPDPWLHLAALGLVGFDASERVWFHREVPFLPERLDALYPRLAGARRLVEAGAVSPRQGGAAVRSGEHLYQVDLTTTPPTCTCAWFNDNLGARGPCKHVIAARAVLEGDPT
jgi:hypothetical protein